MKTLLHRIANRSRDLLFLPGLDHFWRRRLQGKVLALGYPRVGELGQAPFLDRFGVAPIAPSQLLAELSFLRKQGATFLTFSDLRRGRFPGPEEFGVIVCFDDCFRDTYANGVGVVEWLTAHGVLFQASAMVDAPTLIWEHALYWHAHDPARAEALEKLAHARLPASQALGGDALVAHLREVEPMAAVEALLAEATAQAGRGASERLAELAATLYPSARYLRAAWSNGHEIASHGHHHYPRHSLDAAGFEQELIRSQQELEAIVGRKPQAFAYPFNSHGPADAELSGGHYFQVATLEARPISRETPRLAIPRCSWPGPHRNKLRQRRWLWTGHL